MDIRQRQRLIIKFISVVLVVVFIGLPIAAYYLYHSNTYPNSALELADFLYPEYTAACGDGKPGAAGKTNHLKTAKGFRYLVKTPRNYQSSYAHPLLVVYTPSVSGSLMEKYVGLTHEATKAGFIIAYVDGQSLSISSITELGTVPLEVINQWCVDEQKVFFTGHSDGGTLSTALAFLPDTPFHPAAIAPSAAGITGDELGQYTCPKPLSVMVMHNDGDTHFPGFGAQTAKWWAACNRCEPEPVLMDDTGACVQYKNCSGDVETLYCEGKGGSHMTWPHLNAVMLNLFQRTSSAG